MKTPALTFAWASLGKRSWRSLKAACSLSRAVINCFIRLRLKHTWLCSSPQWTRSAVAGPASVPMLSERQRHQGYLVKSLWRPSRKARILSSELGNTIGARNGDRAWWHCETPLLSNQSQRSYILVTVQSIIIPDMWHYKAECGINVA